MSYGRVGCLLVSLILITANSARSPQVRTNDHKPIFENRDFKVFPVKEPDELLSISDESNFGVLVFRGGATTWEAGRKCPFCFTGPTGSRNLLVYGTTGGVVPIAEKHFGANKRPVWVAVRPDAEITEKLFKENLPEDFRDSVRDDLFAIGYLA